MSTSSRGDSPTRLGDLLLVLSAPLAVFTPLASGLPLSAALLGGSAAWVYLAWARRAPTVRVVSVLLTWAFTLSFATILFTVAEPERAADLIPRGSVYWAEMKPWLLTGVGKESTPSDFIPEHLLHVSAFLLLALVSGGWAALVLGALLMGYMSFYVGQVVLLAEVPLAAGVLAWHPWALMRVVAFVILGVSVARILLLREGLSSWWRTERPALALAASLWVGDILLKTLISRPWSGVIRSLAGIDGG